MVFPPDESIEIQLEIIAGAVPGARTNHTFIIRNLKSGLTLSSGPGNEVSGVLFDVSRLGEVGEPVSVEWATSDEGTAAPGTDFLPTNGVVTIPAGERQVHFRVPWIDSC